MLAVFDRLNFNTDATSDTWIVCVPSYRKDLYRPVDLVKSFCAGGTDKIPQSIALSHGLHRSEYPCNI